MQDAKSEFSKLGYLQYVQTDKCRHGDDVHFLHTDIKVFGTHRWGTMLHTTSHLQHFNALSRRPAATLLFLQLKNVFDVDENLHKRNGRLRRYHQLFG